jgi:hypothetical protein
VLVRIHPTVSQKTNYSVMRKKNIREQKFTLKNKLDSEFRALPFMV